MAHNWDDFLKPEWETRCMPDYGDGDTMASQAETALCKLVFKWFNDGDVYDNRYGMSGWANDISGSANWLAKNLPRAAEILRRICEIGGKKDKYTDILYDLCVLIYDTPGLLEALNHLPKIGDAYNEDGEFEFIDAYGEFDDENEEM